MLFEILFIFKGIMILRIRHGTGFEPAVEHFGNALHCTAAAFARNRNLVDELFVQIFGIDARKRFELFPASDADRFFARIAFPNRNRIAPKAVSADRPIARARKPFSEPPVFDVRRPPIDFGIRFEQYVVLFGNFYEPASDAAVDERRSAPPAMRIGVHDRFPFDEFSFGFQTRHDVFVAVFYEAAFVVGHFMRKAAFGVDRFGTGNTRTLKKLAVVFAETGRRMDDARTVFGRNEISVEYSERAGRSVVHYRQMFKIRKKRFVGRA